MTKHTADYLSKIDIRQKFERLGRKFVTEVSPDISGVTMPETLEECFLAGEAFAVGAYSFNKEELKKSGTFDAFKKRDTLSLSVSEKAADFPKDPEKRKAFSEGVTFGNYVNYARTLGNLPVNLFGTDEMVGYINRVFEGSKVEVSILRNGELKKLSANGILSVNEGSDKEAAVAILRYKGDESLSLTGLVGKGVMFDTGGHHLKDMSSMYGMKYDMCGAATVLELVEYLSVKRKRANIVAVLPLVENSIGPKASRPGDVIVTNSGLSVEIMNTDAEGRLILCDAISIAASEGAKTIIDLATLTYSCREALGDEVTGIFANDEEAYGCFLQASESSGEKIWRLPLGKPYSDYVRKSNFADLINYGPGLGAGASFAACFLEAFVPKGVKWLHLDYVGPSTVKNSTEELAAGATGAMAGSIYRYLEGSV
ncbi:MAG: leucyl aminopeptidase family protein [Lachnospiraceae bacterium]|nr:leucyl aminopeptidase family protein [Lachnospiraceae bacterium]